MPSVVTKKCNHRAMNPFDALISHQKPSQGFRHSVGTPLESNELHSVGRNLTKSSPSLCTLSQQIHLAFNPYTSGWRAHDHSINHDTDLGVLFIAHLETFNVHLQLLPLFTPIHKASCINSLQYCWYHKGTCLRKDWFEWASRIGVTLRIQNDALCLVSYKRDIFNSWNINVVNFSLSIGLNLNKDNIFFGTKLASWEKQNISVLT